MPTVTSILYLTSANCSHHAYHLAQYKKMIGIDFWNCDSIIEWGGGNGSKNKIVRRMRPELTYIIIDLPELLALQYVYLTSIFGVDAVNVISSNAEIIKGKISLISSHSSYWKESSNLKCEGFLSTWALTESPENDQIRVLKTAFFNAKHILMASMNNENNFMRYNINFSDNKNNPVSVKHVLNVPTGLGIGDGNEYWFQ